MKKKIEKLDFDFAGSKLCEFYMSEDYDLKIMMTTGSHVNIKMTFRGVLFVRFRRGQLPHAVYEFSNTSNEIINFLKNYSKGHQMDPMVQYYQLEDVQGDPLIEIVAESLSIQK